MALTIGILEVVGGVVSGSLALLSDAGHMASDVAALLLALVALRLASRPADPRRTYGYHRLEILAALANGALLLYVAAAVVHEAWERFDGGHPVDLPVAASIAGVGLVANILGLWLLAPGRGHLNVRGAFLHVLSDTLSSVAVIVGAGIMWLTEAWIVDPILSVLIAVFIVWSAIRLVRESVDVLLEAVPRHLDHGEVCGLICAIEGVEAVHDVHIWTISSGLVALSAHAVVDSERMHETDDILQRIKAALREAYGIDHTTIQVETERYEHAEEAVC